MRFSIHRMFLTILMIALVAAGSRAADFVISDFSDPDADIKKWSAGDSGSSVISVEPIMATDTNLALKVVFNKGSYPGFQTRPPMDWSTFEVLRFVVHAPSAASLNIRIDDENSHGYDTRYNRTFALKAGHNLCQIDSSDIARVLDLKRIRNLIFFLSSPPPGVVIYFDDFVLGDKLSETVPFIPYSERMDLQPTLDIESPHIQFAKPLAGGPVNAFMMTSVSYGREVSELMQRIDLKVSQMTWDRTYDQNTWGMGDFYGKRGHMFDFVLMQRYLSSSLQGPETFNALCITTPQGWDRFPKGAREALIKRVKENGEGLVLVFPFPGGVKDAVWPDDLKELSALIDSSTDYADLNTSYFRAGNDYNNREKWTLKGKHPITDGVALDAIPMTYIQIQKYKLSPDATVLIETEKGLPVMAVKQVGKGRVVTIGWRTNGALTPALNDSYDLAKAYPYQYQEMLYSLIGRAILWAAGREFPPVTKPVAPVLSIDCEKNSRCQFSVQKNAAGQITNWTSTYTPASESSIQTLIVRSPETLTRGESLTVTVDIPDALKDIANLASETPPAAHIVLRYSEMTSGRKRIIEDDATIQRTSVESADAAVRYAFVIPTARVRQSLTVFDIDLIDNAGKVIATGSTEIVVAPKYQPGESRWNDYETLMWSVDGLPFLRGFEDGLISKAECTGVMETGWKSLDQRMRWARAGLRLMCHNVASKPLHIPVYTFTDYIKEYEKTKSKTALIRKPSYADPVFLESERKRTAETINMLMPFNPTNYITCDEPSYTSYARDFDFDFHPENIKLFRNRLSERFKTINALNAAINVNLDSFDAIEPPTTDEARAAQNWGLWNLWRVHNDDVMAEGYKLYRDAVQSVDPNGTISISGTQSATPFDGFDWSKLSQYFGTMSGYGYGHQDRKRISFNPSMLNAVPAGYGRSGNAVDYQIWTKLVENGGGHVLFWWIAFRNPDLTFCQSAKDYIRLFREMRGGLGRQYINARREFSPVAVLYSMNSLRASYAQTRSSGRGSSYSNAEDKVTLALIEAGYDPLFISEEQVAAGELETRGIRALFLPKTLSLGYGDKTGGLAVKPALERFMNLKGLVVATDDFEYDEFIQPRKPDAAFLNRIVKFDSIPSISDALSKVGAKLPVIVKRKDGAPVPKLEVTIHRLTGDSGARIVTLIRPPVGTKEVVGGDGVIQIVPDNSGGEPVERCVVDLSSFGPARYFRLRGISLRDEPAAEIKLKDLVRTRAISDSSGILDVDLNAGDGFSIAVLPYQVKSVSVAGSISDRALVLQWTLTKDVAAKPFAPHVVNIRIYLPSDSKPNSPLVCRYAFNAETQPDGRGRYELPLSLTELELIKIGARVRADIHDILTGGYATTEVRGR